MCTVIDRAITLELMHNPRSDRHAMLLPTVHSEHCTGCGKCERACVLPGESAIKVLPIRLAQGSRAEHYRRGWEEKDAAGGSLIGEQIELPVRGMEDQPYGDTRLRPDAPPPGRRRLRSRRLLNKPRPVRRPRPAPRQPPPRRPREPSGRSALMASRSG